MRGGVAALAGIALLSSACLGVEQGPHVPPGIDDQICKEVDLPEEFVLKTEGDFSPADLANGSDAALREGDLERAGMRGGRFNYWQRSNPDEPEAPGTEVVCQAIAFQDEAAAAAYLQALIADPNVLAAHAFAWLSDGSWTARETSGVAVGAAVRTFVLGREETGEPAHVVVLATHSGRFVRMMFQTLSGAESGGLTAAIAAAISARAGGVE